MWQCSQPADVFARRKNVSDECLSPFSAHLCFTAMLICVTGTLVSLRVSLQLRFASVIDASPREG